MAAGLSALSVLAGGAATLAGAALQGFIGSRRDERSWSRLQESRWDERKLEICTNFLVDLHRAAFEISLYAADLDERRLSRSDPQAIARLEDYRSAVADLRRMVQQVRLTMPDAAVNSADLAYERLMDLRHLAPLGKGVHEAQWHTTHAELDAARRSFRDEVRAHLGIIAE